MEFKPSYYTHMEKGICTRKFDLQYRNSSETYVDNKELTSVANKFLSIEMEKIGEELVEVDL